MTLSITTTEGDVDADTGVCDMKYMADERARQHCHLKILVYEEYQSHIVGAATPSERDGLLDLYPSLIKFDYRGQYGQRIYGQRGTAGTV